MHTLLWIKSSIHDLILQFRWLLSAVLAPYPTTTRQECYSLLTAPGVQCQWVNYTNNKGMKHLPIIATVVTNIYVFMITAKGNKSCAKY